MYYQSVAPCFLPSSLNSAPCPCASLLSQRARCGWIRDRALPTHPAGEALPRVPRPREREKKKEAVREEGKRIWTVKMEVNERRWRKEKKKLDWEFWCGLHYKEEKRKTFSATRPPDCVRFLLKIQSSYKATSSQWSTTSLSEYHFRPVGVIVVQLTERREPSVEC